jgi:HD-GYP domain-containing protein (c-di-GMP phosphodiesterase class II)
MSDLRTPRATEPAPVSWPELMAAASLAADTGMGLPLETGLATCLVSLELGRRLKLDATELRRTHQLALLQHIGCTTAATDVAAVMGDELVMRNHAALLDFSDQRAMFRFLLAHVARANPVPARPAALARALVGGRRVTAAAGDACEAAQLLGGRCGYLADSVDDLAFVYEHWDGSGFPAGARGETIPVPVRVVAAATLAVNAERLMGAEAAMALVHSRSGHTLAPDVADAVTAEGGAVLAPLRSRDSLWDRVVDAAEGTHEPPTESEVDDALSAFADFADLKSPFLAGHSPSVARLASDAAARAGLDVADTTALRRAGYVHDLGRVAVSSRVWSTSETLRPDEREQVRLHPYYTNQVLARTPYLRSIAELASAHHERLDGSGYYRGSHAPALPFNARVLAAADTFATKTEPRPHRPALDPEAAAAHVRAEASAGRLDSTAVEAVLAAAGQRADAPTPPTLTRREVEVLRLVARGASTKQVARALSISPKTVDGHLQRIYPKIGVGTRAGATLYAVRSGLVP